MFPCIFTIFKVLDVQLKIGIKPLVIQCCHNKSKNKGLCKLALESGSSQEKRLRFFIPIFIGCITCQFSYQLFAIN